MTPVGEIIAVPGIPASEALLEKIAEICHEANRAICQANGDHSQLPWSEAAGWQRESARKGVLFTLKNPDLTPADQHNAWMRDKAAEGWKYGPVKDAEEKTHPCMFSGQL